MSHDAANFPVLTGESGVPDGYFRDPQGRLVPAQLVKPADLLQDQLVRDLMDRAESLSRTLADFKAAVFNDVGAFLAILEGQYSVKRGGKKGNMTFTSYDGLRKVQVAVADRMTFGPELQVAKELVDECIQDWGKDAGSEIRVLVDHAFRVDKEGQVSRESIFSLRRVAIDDDRWKRAMGAIADSIRVEGSKTYVRFHRRHSPQSPWQSVSLDLANA